MEERKKSFLITQAFFLRIKCLLSYLFQNMNLLKLSSSSFLYHSTSNNKYVVNSA